MFYNLYLRGVQEIGAPPAPMGSSLLDILLQMNALVKISVV